MHVPKLITYIGKALSYGVYSKFSDFFVIKKVVLLQQILLMCNGVKQAVVIRRNFHNRR